MRMLALVLIGCTTPTPSGSSSSASASGASSPTISATAVTATVVASSSADAPLPASGRPRLLAFQQKHGPLEIAPASEIVETYTGNAMSGDAKFKGKPVMVIGILKAIEKDEKGPFAVVWETAEPPAKEIDRLKATTIRLRIDEGDAVSNQHAIAAKPGDLVTLACVKFDGLVDDNGVAKTYGGSNCVFFEKAVDSDAPASSASSASPKR